MDVFSTQYLLGIRPTLKGLLVDPSIPAAWDEFCVEKKNRKGSSLRCRFWSDLRLLFSM